MSTQVVGFRSIHPESGVPLLSNVTDVDGKTRINTPGKMVFERGETVTFTFHPGPTIEQTDPVDGTVSRVEYSLSSVRVDGEVQPPGNTLTLAVQRDLLVQLDYTPNSPAWAPSPEELRYMLQQLKFSVPEDTYRDKYILLWDDQPVALFGRPFFSSKKEAFDLLQRYVAIYRKEWLQKLPTNLKTWLQDAANRKRFTQYWLQSCFKLIPFSEFKTKIVDIKQFTTI